jgi:hypothetical protein
MTEKDTNRIELCLKRIDREEELIRRAVDEIAYQKSIIQEIIWKEETIKHDINNY